MSSSILMIFVFLILTCLNESYPLQCLTFTTEHFLRGVTKCRINTMFRANSKHSYYVAFMIKILPIYTLTESPSLSGCVLEGRTLILGRIKLSPPNCNFAMGLSKGWKTRTQNGSNLQELSGTSITNAQLVHQICLF